MSEIDTTQLISQMRAMAAAAEGMPPTPAGGAGEFSTMLQRAIDGVNNTQQSAAQLATAFELGEGDADLAEVMIALQKARISFQALTEVRNHLISAYKDILNMPV